MKHKPEPKGLFAFRNMTRGTVGTSSLVVRFTEPVTDLHMKQLYDAMHCWMVAQKLLAENNGQAPTREAIDARWRELRSGQSVAGADAVRDPEHDVHPEAESRLP